MPKYARYGGQFNERQGKNKKTNLIAVNICFNILIHIISVLWAEVRESNMVHFPRPPFIFTSIKIVRKPIVLKERFSNFSSQVLLKKIELCHFPCGKIFNAFP